LENKNKKLNTKLCSDPGSNAGNVEPSDGSLTRCPNTYEVIQKKSKKNSLIFYGQKPVTCSLWDAWLVPDVREPDFSLANTKKAGKIDMESWKFTIFGLVISKENTCELLLFLFEITCPPWKLE
jgi:hypothetical protein